MLVSDQMASIRSCWRQWIRSREFEALVDEITTGTAQRVLNMEDLVEFRMPVPPREKEAVAELMQLSSTTTSTLNVLAERDLLRERRQALITAAVTGEIEV